MNDIYNFLRYHDQLSSSGMPTAEQMKAVAEAGVQVVINLAPHDVPNALPAEAELVTALGMEYVHIPVVWRAPQAADLTRFMQVMDAQAGKKVHVHCEANYRASSFIMLYRVLRLGWRREDAIPVMERMWNPEDFPVWEAFIRERLG
jgi:uncharacterized protein (TIGR01244 family)